MICEKCTSPVTQNSDTSISDNNLPDPEYQDPESLEQENSKEEILWVLSAQAMESFFKRKACYLVFMKDKLLVAHLSSQRQKEESAKISSQAKAEGKGFLKSSGAIMQHWSNYYKKYYSMTPGEILAEEAINFAIQYENIVKLFFKAQLTDIDDDGSSSGHQGKFDITLLKGEKIKFSHTQSHNDSVKKMLTELFGEKLKYKK